MEEPLSSVTAFREDFISPKKRVLSETSHFCHNTGLSKASLYTLSYLTVGFLIVGLKKLNIDRSVRSATRKFSLLYMLILLVYKKCSYLVRKTFFSLQDLRNNYLHLFNTTKYIFRDVYDAEDNINIFQLLYKYKLSP